MNPRASATNSPSTRCSPRKATSFPMPPKRVTKTSLTQGEIDALRADARAEGVNAGEVRAAEAVAAACKRSSRCVATVLQRTHADIELVRAEAAKLALVAARTLGAFGARCPALCRSRSGSAPIPASGDWRAARRFASEPESGRGIAAAYREIAHEEGYEGRVQISADPNIRGADCRIEWRGGGAERSEAALEAALAELITRRFSQIHHPLTED